MIIDFAKLAALGVLKEQPRLVLRNLDNTAIQTLGNAYNLKANIRYNEVSAITFDIPAYVDGVKTPHYDDIIGMRIIDMLKWGQFILINPETSNDGIREIKSCKAYSLEYELTYKQTYIPEGTYNFWNPFDSENTILGMIINDLKAGSLLSWRIGSVDASLIGKYRTLSEESSNIYNLIKSTVQKTYGCIFDFDTYNRRIHVRDVHSGNYTNGVNISLNNLAKQINIEEDTENIVTVLDVNGGEDVDIRMVNPLGTNKIYNLDYFMNQSHFSTEMIRKWEAWKNKYESIQPRFYNLSVEYSLKTAAIATANAALTDINGTELESLENQRAVCIEWLAQHADNDPEYQNFQERLNELNQRVSEVQTEINTQKDIISELENEQELIAEAMEEITNSIAFKKYFTEDELLILSLYFKEDAIEESSFVLTNVQNYNTANISSKYESLHFSFSGGTVTKTLNNDTNLFMITGGKVVCSSSLATTIKANVIRASYERDTNGKFVLALYLSDGRINNVDFPGGCISFTGHSLVPQSDAQSISASDIYATGTFLNFDGDNGNLYFTRDTTEYERYAVEWDLYDYGKSCLEALAFPTYKFDVSSANFLMLDDFNAFVREIELGQCIYLNTGSEVLEPICIGVDIDFEKMSSMSLLFSDKYSASDKAFKLVDLLDNSISMGKTLNSNKLSYSSFIDSGASTAVKTFMDSALDVARNKVLSSSGQGVSWDNTGLHLRKYKNSSEPEYGFEDEQIWMINNAIVFTDDNWKSSKLAIGKIFDKNLIGYSLTQDKAYNSQKTYYIFDEESKKYIVYTGGAGGWSSATIYEYNEDGSAYGIAAPYIVGTLLAGRNLVIDTGDGTFKVDSEGVHINAMKFYITQSNNLKDTLDGLSGEISKNANKITGAQSSIRNLNKTINTKISTYYTDNPPSDEVSEGDLWFNTSKEDSVNYTSNTLYRYTNNDWEEIRDGAISVAYQAASNAQTTADQKITTYYDSTNPSNKWDTLAKSKNIGDIWYNTMNGKAYRWNGSEWDTLEDKDLKILSGAIGSLSSRLRDVNQTLSQVILDNGYLDAEQLQGVIDSQATKMKNGTGNVLFDSDGIWLMNASTKDEATAAVWMNEQGIMFGSKKNGKWKGSTAIGFEGIVADALASKVLTSVYIRGGNIQIGDENSPAFQVDEFGNLTANSGVFKGSLESPTLTGKLYAGGTEEDTWIIGAGLSIGGEGILNTPKNANFYVDTSGNVTMKGDITLSGSINLSAGKITWSSSNTPVQVQYSGDGINDWHPDFRPNTNHPDENDYYARYSYDGGDSWTGAILIQGRNGEDGKNGTDGEDGKDANVDFGEVNAILGNLFTDWKGEAASEITGSYIYSPKIKGGEIYGTNIFSGDGGYTDRFAGVTQITGKGITVSVYNGDTLTDEDEYDFDPADYVRKIGLGYSSGDYAYPYLVLGAGSGDTGAKDAGVVAKFGHGIWIGTSDVLSQMGAEPMITAGLTTGIFIEFPGTYNGDTYNGAIYQYIDGKKSKIGSGGGTATAVFG